MLKKQLRYFVCVCAYHSYIYIGKWDYYTIQVISMGRVSPSHLMEVAT